MNLFKIDVRGLAESLSDKLATALSASGFVIVGKLDQKRTYRDCQFKYEVIAVDLPRASAQMVKINRSEGLVVPACISLIEIYPGEVSVFIANPTVEFAKDNNELLYMATEVTTKLQEVVHAFAREANRTPDLVTSWS